LEEIFITFGFPNCIVSDNGSPFQGEFFQKYVKGKGINYVHSPPRHPQSNGLAERAVQNFKSKMEKFCQKAIISISQVQLLINKFLFNYRNQPTTDENIIPSQRVFNFKPNWLLEVATKVNYELSNPVKSVVNTKEKIMNYELNSKNIMKEKSEIVKTPKLIFKKGEDILYTTEHEGKTVTTKGKVLEKKSNFVYVIVLDSGHSLKAHINQLRKFYIRAKIFPSISSNTEYLDPPQIDSPPKSRKKSDSNETSNNETMSPEPRRSQRPKTRTKFFGIFNLKGGDL
jgi:hypothetical protein